MNLTVNYFGLIAEITECSYENLDFSGSIFEFRQWLYEQYPLLKEKDFQVAQDQILVSNETLISGQTLAVLPPFAGG